MSKRLNLTLLSILICIASFVMILAATDTLKVGSGFGRETKFVIKTQNSEILETYLNDLERRGIETEFKSISDYEFEVTFSALENVDIIKSEVSKIIPDVNFSYEGSFGNIATYINNQGFVSTYLFLLIFSIFLYFTVRYRFWGFVTGIQLTLSFAVGLSVVNALKLPFTEMLWYAIVVVLMVIAMSKHSVIKNNNGMTSDSIISSGYDFIKRPLYLGIFNLLFGLLLLMSNLIDGESIGVFIISFSLVMILADLILSFLMPRIVETFAAEDNDYLEFIDTWSIPSRLDSKVLFKRISLVGLTVMILLLIFTPKVPLTQFRGRDYDSQKVLIVSDSNAKSYLEVEAMLNSIGLFDKQLSYSTSDSNQLWIYFDREVSESDLKIARNIISNALGIDVAYYITKEMTFPTQHLEFYLTIVATIFLAAATIWVLAGSGPSIKISLLSVIGSLVFTVLVFMFAPEIKEEYILMIYGIPVYFSNYYSTPKNINNLSNIDEYIDDFSLELVTLFSMVVILSGLVLIIVPIQLGVDLIKNVILYAIAIEITCLLYVHVYRLSRKYVKKNDDESY